MMDDVPGTLVARSRAKTAEARHRWVIFRDSFSEFESELGEPQGPSNTGKKRSKTS